MAGRGRSIMEAGKMQLSFDEENPQRDGQSAVTSNNNYVIQIIVAFAFAAGSFTIMCKVPFAGNEVGRAVRRDAIVFSVFLVAGTLAFVASMAAGTILVTAWHISAKMEYFIRITLLAAAMLFVLIFHATAYVVVPLNQKWIVLCFGGAGTIAVALLLFHQLSTTFPRGSAI